MKGRDKKSRHFVVDASVARAAGSLGALSPTSQSCRQVLDTLFQVCHRVVMSQELRAEWDRNASKASLDFLREMRRRGKVVPPKEAVPGMVKMRATIERLCGEAQAEAILKDFHLLEAAWESGRLILSLDDAARSLLVPLVKRLPRLGTFTWVNPTEEGEEVIGWLTKGAPDEERRYLRAGLKPPRPEPPRSGRRGQRRRS
jgi:hypothetical protein